MSLLVKGGVLMIPIVLCSIIALAIIIERFIQIRRARAENARFVSAIRGRIRRGNLQDAIEICQEYRSAPLANLFLDALYHVPLGEKRTREVIQEGGERQAENLERNLGGLATIAGGAPLLGFLGTVLGMIQAFQRIETLGGNVDASVLAGGIWAALLTTAAGLSVAAPSFFAHNYLQSRIFSEIRAMEDRSRELMLLLTTGEDRIGGAQGEDEA
jgi:biopolymer transport protein ExbB